MYYLYILLLLHCLLSPLSTHSQSQISGTVTAQTGEPLTFANVLLLQPHDSSLVKGMVAENDGRFMLENISNGQYLFVASMTGYQPYQTSLLVEYQPVMLGNVQLSEATQELEEVVVRSQKPMYEQQIDRLVVNVQNSITSTGGTALDILARSPGVALNQQSGAIALNGKEGVAVMINGKLSRMPAAAVMDMLRGMNAANIEKIELISNPPARYDAEGVGGLINLVLKKDMDYGANGSVSLTAGYGYGEKTGANLTLNHRAEKLNLFGEYSFFRDRNRQFADFSRSFHNKNGEIYTSTHGKRWPVSTNHNARLGFDYYITPKTIVGGQIAGYDNKWQMDALNETILRDAQQHTTYVRVDNDEINHWRHLMGNLNLTQTFHEGQELRIDIDYLAYHDNNPTNYVNNYVNASGEVISAEKARIRKETPIRIAVFKADYQQQLTDQVSWEFGIKGTSSRFTNVVEFDNEQNGIWIADTTMSQKHRLSEEIAAAYTSWQIQINANTKVVAGARYEFTDTDLDSEKKQNIINRRYGSLFPNLVVSYDIDKMQNIQFTYGRRLTRPTFNDLAPFVIYFGPNNFMSGNPALQPAFVQNVKLQYQWKDLITSIQYSHERQAIVGFQPHFDPETQAQLVYAENLDVVKSITFTAVFPWQLAPWWSMQNSIIGIRQHAVADYLDKIFAITNYNIQVNTTQSFLLPYDFSLELSAYLQSAHLYGIMHERAIGAVNIGLQKKLKNERGTLSLTWDDLFWTTPWREYFALPEYQLKGEMTFILSEPRIVKLTYARNFGNRKLKANRQRSTGSEEEQKRVN